MVTPLLSSHLIFELVRVKVKVRVRARARARARVRAKGTDW